jgi:hypothetical protein
MMFLQYGVNFYYFVGLLLLECLSSNPEWHMKDNRPELAWFWHRRSKLLSIIRLVLLENITDNWLTTNEAWTNWKYQKMNYSGFYSSDRQDSFNYELIHSAKARRCSPTCQGHLRQVAPTCWDQLIGQIELLTTLLQLWILKKFSWSI